MTISEFERTEWKSGMLADINGNQVEIVSVNLHNMEICVLYGDRTYWIPCCFVNLVNN